MGSVFPHTILQLLGTGTKLQYGQYLLHFRHFWGMCTEHSLFSQAVINVLVFLGLWEQCCPLSPLPNCTLHSWFCVSVCACYLWLGYMGYLHGQKDRSINAGFYMLVL